MPQSQRTRPDEQKRTQRSARGDHVGDQEQALLRISVDKNARKWRRKHEWQP